MGIFSFIAVALISTAISIALAPRPEVKDARPKGFDEVKFPSTDRTRPRPMLFGTREVKSGQLLWAGNYRTKAIREKVGGGPFSSGKRVTVGYKYYMSVMVGFCLGTVEKLGHIRVNDRPAYRPSSMVDIDPVNGLHLQFTGSEQNYQGRVMAGTRTQGPAGNPRSLLDGSNLQGNWFTYPARILGQAFYQNYESFTTPADPNALSPYNMTYRGLCYINVDGYLGEQPQLKDLKATLQRLPKVLWPSSQYESNPTHDIDGDANIAECIWDIISSDEGGLNRDTSDYDLDSFREAAQTLYDEGLGVSFLWDNTTTGDTIIEELMSYADGVLRLNRTTGKYEFFLVRGGYDVLSLKHLGASEIKEVANLATPSYDKLANSVVVEYSDRDLYFEPNSFNANDIGSALDAGRKETRTLSFPYITKGEVAGAIAYRELRIYSLALATFKVVCNRRAYDVLVGDVIRVSYAPLGIEEEIVRVTDADYGSYADGDIVLTVVQDRFAYDGSIFGAGGGAVPETPSVVPDPPNVIAMEYSPYALTEIEGVRDCIGIVEAGDDTYAYYDGYQNFEFDEATDIYTGQRRTAVFGYSLSEIAPNSDVYTTIAVSNPVLGDLTYADITHDPGQLTNLIRVGDTWGTFERAEKVLTPDGGFAYLLLHGVDLGRLTLSPGLYPAGSKVYFFSRAYERSNDQLEFTGSFDDWRLKAVPIGPDGQPYDSQSSEFEVELDNDNDYFEQPYAVYKLQDQQGNSAGPYPFALTVDTGVEWSYEGQEPVHARLYDDASLPTIGTSFDVDWYIRDAYSWDGDNYTVTYDSGSDDVNSGTNARILGSVSKADFWPGDVAPEFVVGQYYPDYPGRRNLCPTTGWFRVDPETIGFLPDEAGDIPRGGVYYDGATLYSIGLKGTKAGTTTSVIMSSSDGGETWTQAGTSSSVKWLHKIEVGTAYGKSRDQGFVLNSGTTFYALNGSRPVLPSFLGGEAVTTGTNDQVNTIIPEIGGDYFVGTDIGGMAIVSQGNSFQDRGAFMSQLGDVSAAIQYASGDYVVAVRQHDYERISGDGYRRWGMTHTLKIYSMSGFDTDNAAIELSEAVSGEFVRDVHLEDLGAYLVLVFAQKTTGHNYEVKAYSSGDGGGTWSPLTLPTPDYKRTLVMVKAFGRAIFVCGDVVYSTDGSTVDSSAATSGTYCGLGLKSSTELVKIEVDAGSLTVEESTDGVTWAAP